MNLRTLSIIVFLAGSAALAGMLLVNRTVPETGIKPEALRQKQDELNKQNIADTPRIPRESVAGHDAPINFVDHGGIAVAEGTREINGDEEFILNYGVNSVEGNSLLNKLVLENPPWLEGALIQIIFDEHHAERWRNFSVQHAANLYEITRSKAIYSAIVRAIKSNEPSVREVSLYSIARIHDSFEIPVTDPRSEALYSYIKDVLATETSPAVVDAGFRSAQLLTLPQFVDVAMQFATDKSKPLQVRIAALDYIAEIKPKISCDSIAQLVDKSDSRLSQSAYRAIASIQSGP